MPTCLGSVIFAPAAVGFQPHCQRVPSNFKAEKWFHPAEIALQSCSDPTGLEPKAPCPASETSHSVPSALIPKQAPIVMATSFQSEPAIKPVCTCPDEYQNTVP